MTSYLDYNASSPIDTRVLSQMIEVYQNNIGNADSRTHEFGENARKVVEEARKKVSNLLDVTPNEIFFTSGATESNNIAIQGLKDYAIESDKKHIITSAIEHKAVLETVKYMQTQGFDIDIIHPDRSGRIKSKDVIDKLRNDTLLVSIMHVNNETGIIQPVDEIGEILKSRNTLFHIDATQSCGKLVDEIKKLNYDMLSFSAHKFGGPQGVGALVLKKKSYKLPPVKSINYGGQQEHGIRPGTLPVALIAGCGKACELAGMEYQSNLNHFKKIFEAMISELEISGLDYCINGDVEFNLGNTLNLDIKGVSSEALMISSKQYCGVSNGSACTSKSYKPSYVLEAMGLTQDEIESSIRISWGSKSEVSEVISNFRKLIGICKNFVL